MKTFLILIQIIIGLAWFAGAIEWHWAVALTPLAVVLAMDLLRAKPKPERPRYVSGRW